METKQVAQSLAIAIVASLIATILVQVVTTYWGEIDLSIEELSLFFSGLSVFLSIFVIIKQMKTGPTEPTKPEAKEAPAPPKKPSISTGDKTAATVHGVNRSEYVPLMDSSGVYVKDIPKGVHVTGIPATSGKIKDGVRFVQKPTKVKSNNYRTEIVGTVTPVARQMGTKQPHISELSSMNESIKTHTPKDQKPPNDDKPYSEHTGYAKHKGTLVWFRIWVNKDNPSERQIQEVGENPFCTVCKTPLKEKRKRGYYPWFECPECGKEFGESFKPEPTTPWLKSQIDDDLRERGIIPDD